MQDLAVILMFISLVAMFAGVVGLLKGNLKLLNVKNRKQSGLLLLVSLALCIVFASFVPQETSANEQNNTSIATQTEDVTESDNAIHETEQQLNPDLERIDTDKGLDPSDYTTNAPSSSTEYTEPDDIRTSGQLEVHYIDVGQGASQLIIAPNGRSMLIDAGNNDDEQRVVSYLKDQGISKVDILIVTHPDADHSGGADAVVDAFDIGTIYMPKVQSNTKTFESLLTSIDNKNLSIKTAKSGLTLDLDSSLNIHMIGPVGYYNDVNDMSAVVRLEYGETSFLFTGDAGSESERDMLDAGVKLRSDVLLVGHHGSNTSTTIDFLRAVAPDYAVIQVGDNKYGHPTDEILSRLEKSGAKIYRNDMHGNVVATSDGKHVSFDTNPWVYTPPTKNQPSKQDDTIPTAPTTPDATPVTEPKETAPQVQHTKSINATATVDQATPEQNASLTVQVHVNDEAGKPVPGAKVELTLAYKSKDTVYSAVTGHDGIAVLTFKIGRAAQGFTVLGDITVRADGETAQTQISFTPQ